MNLRYYLRGLGLGILVTALILSIAGSKKHSMTDAQIKERAKELGMIENTVLVEKTQENEEEELPKVAEAVEPEKTEDVSDVIEQEEPVKIGEVKDSNEADELKGITEAESAEVTAEQEESKQEEAEKASTEKETNKQEQKDKQVKDVTDDDPEAPIEKEERNSDKAGEGNITAKDQPAKQEETPDPANGDAETVSHEQGTLTIVSGDSSYSVAKKLYEMGIVSSVEQTDKFLCTNGYDRTIRTGTYTIDADETLEQIAKKINGK